MFTGIIEELGRVHSLEPRGDNVLIEIEAHVVMEGTKDGNSIAVNGVCLTALDVCADGFRADGSRETLQRSTLGSLHVGSVVNLERAVTPQTRLGGHIVQGHVDGVGEVVSVTPEGPRGGAEIWEFSAPGAVLRYAVEKGSVCVDGISLTLVSVGESSFTVSILPQTREATNLQSLSHGDRVNLEADVIGKYVERLLMPRLDLLQTSERSVEDAV